MESAIGDIQVQENPGVIANKIGRYLSGAMREEEISLYEAWLIHEFKIRFNHMHCKQPGWGGRYRIQLILGILNHLLLARCFNDRGSEELAESILREALELNREVRSHYVLDVIHSFFDEDQLVFGLKLLQEWREEYEITDEGLGPFHNEVFPYHYYSPEDLLLAGWSLENKTISDPVVEFMVILERKML